ncbi:uncharacterized protein LOC143783244 [Ranitomeya variabilis]|uniref:uncharacterized protein LOC143783244 n=1 Tax=Ranitomeya variabilis TaxID=490064 RepID=UPI0040560ECA
MADTSPPPYDEQVIDVSAIPNNITRMRIIFREYKFAFPKSQDESESELQEHVFDSDSDEDFIPQNISSESEDSEGTNPEDIPSTSTGDRAHAVMLPRDHPPGRGQKKSAKRPRNERTTDNDGGEGNATTNTREGESEGILVSADGIQWKPVEIGQHLPGRRDSQNILREAPGPTGYARRNIIIDSPLSAWRLFFDSYILTHIKNCTLAEACRNNNLQFTLSDEELDAFIAIFYARGISGTNRHSISSIWCNDWGIPFCKATMSRDRFVEIMRFLRFDEKSTRSERLQMDKFALFSTVWDRFIANCIACYKPGPYITVDEQLFPSKTRCPFTQYMPSKPDKYGHKYWLAVDKESKYLANGFPYLGKDDTRRAEDRLADHVVMKLLDPFLKKGRNVTTDNYFTSVKLAKQLKSKGTTIVGTLNKIRREVPKEIKSMKEELYNTKVFRNGQFYTYRKFGKKLDSIMEDLTDNKDLEEDISMVEEEGDLHLPVGELIGTLEQSKKTSDAKNYWSGKEKYSASRTLPPSRQKILEKKMQDLILQSALEPVPTSQVRRGVYSPVILVPKPSGKWLLIISLRRYLRIAVTLNGNLQHFQFKVLPFGITTAPYVFTKVDGTFSQQSTFSLTVSQGPDKESHEVLRGINFHCRGCSLGLSPH